MGRVITPVGGAVESLEEEDWLASSSRLASSDTTQPAPPPHPSAFKQNLHPVAEHQEEETSSRGS